MSPLPNQPLVTNSPSTHLHYLTGRRNLLSLHTVLNLLPRHNAVQYIQDLVWGVVDPVNELGDELVLDYTLGENGKGQLGEGVGVWGVVRKSGVLTKIRKERWDVVSTSFHVCSSSHLSLLTFSGIHPRPLTPVDLLQDGREPPDPPHPHALDRIRRLDRLPPQRPQCRFVGRLEEREDWGVVEELDRQFTS